MIDDDPVVIEQVEFLFSLKWPEVDFVSASEGKAGYQMAEIIKPDLIILGMIFPDMDGLEVFQEIRKSSQVPIMVLTMRNQPFIETNTKESGTDDYIVKPFAPYDFLSRVKALARGARASSSLSHIP
jgi:DNA-binding response OmpR family regulator